MSSKKNKLCIIVPTPNAYSETFIQAHIERLPYNILVLNGGNLSQITQEVMDKYGSKTWRYIEYLKHFTIGFLMSETWDDFHRMLIIQFFRKNGVDAVLAEYGVIGANFIEICETLKIPLVVHFHGYDAYKFDVIEQNKSRYKELFQKAAALIVVSKDMKKQLQKLGAKDNNLHYNVYGVDETLVKKANPAKSPPIFLTVGRFVDKKGPLLVLLSFEQVIQRISDARLIMIGDGYLLNAAKQIAKILGVSSAVDFRGAQSHQSVFETMKQVRAFVQHSLRSPDGDSEGTPLAILEASASGLPIVATRHAGIPDVIIENETGFLVEEGDIMSMAKYMIKIAENPLLAKKMGDAGRIHILNHYRLSSSIFGIEKIIDQALYEYSI